MKNTATKKLYAFSVCMNVGVNNDISYNKCMLQNMRRNIPVSTTH